MFTSVGKKQIKAAIAIFGSMPLPSSSTRIGALATTGIVLISTTIGKNISSSDLKCTNSVAPMMATRLPSTKPTSASVAVGTRLLISNPNFMSHPSVHIVRHRTFGRAYLRDVTGKSQ